MARPWRIQFEGAVYHIMSRGVGRQTIFLDNKDYLQFLQYLEKAVEKFSLDIFAFVLMNNHYHLLLRILQKNLSRFLQWIQTSYAVYYNRRHNHIGHLFQGRYKSILVGEESYWQGLSAYIHLNPIRANIVEKILDYPWSTYHDYVNSQKRYAWVRSEEVLKEFGRTKEEQIREYKNFVVQISGKERSVLDNVKHSFILGDEKFVSWIQKKFTKENKNPYRELKGYNTIRDSGVPEKTIESLIEEFSIKKEELVLPLRRRSNLPRDIGVHILHTSTGLSNKEIGSLFSISPSAVTKASVRIKEKMEEDKDIRRKVNNLINSIFKV